ncbi:4-hydroxy-tetrahydrodipicolinate synthase [Petrimonas sp.]|uniref:4-hydroxy-tetrahydrodipicolinate synthase n=1 Tax=Petrimonas sp. TaxID=2023866 RepID=UPI003F516CE1
MSEINLKGIGVALITPFKKDKSVDFDALGRLVDYQIDGGIDYLVALGTTAETPTLTRDERTEVVRFIIEKNNNRLPIVVGVGSNNTAEIVHELKVSYFSNISAVLSVTPYYNKPNQEGLFQHYRALSEVSPRPIILYNVPGRTGVNMEAETTLRLAKSCPNIVAIKEASGKMDQIRQIIDNRPEGFSVISGDDGIAFDLIKAGGEGVISVLGNALPKEFSEMIHHALAGDFNKAEAENARFVEAIKLLFKDGNPAGVKCMLSEMGYIENELRLPLVAACDETKQEVIEELSSLKKTK